MPPRSPALLAETPLEQPALELSGVPFVGYVDLAAPPGAWRDAPVIVDHKTTSDFRWCKTPETLRADPQAVAYARWAAMRYYGHVDGAPRIEDANRPVDVRFVYYRTRGAVAVRAVDITFAVRELAAPWAGFAADVSLMRGYEALGADAAAAAQVPANLSACDSFGGCPHRARCEALRPARPANGGLSLSAALGLAPAAPAPVVVPVANLTARKDQATMPKLSDRIEAPAPRAEFSLFVDALPVTGAPAMDLAPVLAEVAADVAANAGAVDVLAIEFGKWKGPFRAALIARGLTGAWHVRSASDLGAVAVEALRPYAGTVVQGLR